MSFVMPRRHRLTHGGHKVNFQSPDEVPAESLNLQPMSDLDLMIANGWGDTPQERLPKDWRTRFKAATEGKRGPKGPRKSYTPEDSIATISDPAQT